MTAVERIKAATETVQTELGSVTAQLDEATRLTGRERDLTAIRLVGIGGQGAEYHRLADELRPLVTRVAWFDIVVQHTLDHVIEVPAMARLPQALAHFAKMGVDLSRIHGDLAQLEIDIGDCRSAAQKDLSPDARSTRQIVQALVDATQHSTNAKNTLRLAILEADETKPTGT